MRQQTYILIHFSVARDVSKEPKSRQSYSVSAFLFHMILRHTANFVKVQVQDCEVLQYFANEFFISIDTDLSNGAAGLEYRTEKR